MPHEVIMPALGMAQDSGLIVAWLKAPGDRVSAGEALMEVETDKATMEVEAAHDGWLSDVRAAAGESVPVGQVVAVIADSAEAAAAPAGDGQASDGPAATPDAPAETADATAETVDTAADTAADTASKPQPKGREVIMPALGMAQDTGKIVAWLKAPGDAVAVGEALLEVETDKATMEVEADTAGWLAAVHAAAGAEVPVGEVIAVISAERPEAPTGPSDRPASVKPAKAEPAGAAPAEAEPAAAKTGPEPAGAEPAGAGAAAPRPAAAAGAPAGRILASPKARRLAAERGLDLARLAEAGVAQPFHVADLERLAALPQSVALAAAGVAAAPAAAAGCRLEAEVPAVGFAGFRDWLQAEGGAPPAGALWAAFAAAALRAATAAQENGPRESDPQRIVVQHARPGAAGAPTSYADPDRAEPVPAGDAGPPALVIRDLTGSRLTRGALGAGPAPVLTLAGGGDGYRLSLDFAPGQIDDAAALSLLTGFAERLEEPLRQLL